MGAINLFQSNRQCFIGCQGQLVEWFLHCPRGQNLHNSLNLQSEVNSLSSCIWQEIIKPQREAAGEGKGALGRWHCHQQPAEHSLSRERGRRKEVYFTSPKDKENRWVSLVRALFPLMVQSSVAFLKVLATSTWCLAHNLTSK